MEYYRFVLYPFFGILPSIVWLCYYLQKDLHPEPKKMIVKVFLWGSVITIPVFFIQIGLSELLGSLQALTFFKYYPIAVDIIKWFLIIALTEELLKYVIVRISALKSYALDEPLDAMLYMVVAALGFAAVENILYLFSPIGLMSFDAILEATIWITVIRFIGATFLHTLCSATLGYFVAMSFFDTKKRLQLTMIGILAATLLHGLYDFSIMTLHAPFVYVIPIVIIIELAVFVISAFDKVKKMKSVSKM